MRGPLPLPGADAYGLTVMGTQLIPGTLFFIPLYLTFCGSRTPSACRYWELTSVPLCSTSASTHRSRFGSCALLRLDPARPRGAGHGRWGHTVRGFLKISLPLAKPGIVSTAIYVFMTAWDEMFFAYILGVKTVPVGIRQFVQGAAGTQVRYDYIAAASVVITIPVALMSSCYKSTSSGG
jgi:multiple sugar transport system permease protein